MNREIAEQTAELRPYFDRLQKRAFTVGAIGLVILAISAFGDPQQFFRSYLLGFLCDCIIEVKQKCNSIFLNYFLFH